MNCQNCAAPLDVVLGQDYARCSYCGTFTFFDEPVPVETLESDSARHPCPLCGVPMVRAQIARWRMWHCLACRGLLVAQGDFRAMLAYKRARATGPPSASLPFDPALLERVIHCPVCQGRMDTHPYYGPGRFVIDNCHVCGVVWLDYGELRKAIDGRGRDRRSDGALTRWLERLADEGL